MHHLSARRRSRWRPVACRRGRSGLRDLDAFSIELVNPKGQVDSRATIEAFSVDAAPGTWTVRVISERDDVESFWMRAKLEVDRAEPPANKLLLPNLRPEPGYDFSFSWSERMCDTYGGGEACEPDAPIALAPSCAADETVEDQAARCLRFAMGYQNAGRGPMDLHFGELDPVVGSVDVTQWIYKWNPSESYEDNDHVEHAAGTASYHKTHTHYHYDNIFERASTRSIPRLMS